MSPVRTLDTTVIDRLQELIRVNFVGRDELHAAAELLESRPAADVCQQLSDQLGGRAAELQQWILVLGREPVEPSAKRPLLASSRSKRAAARAQDTILALVSQQAHQVREVYEDAIAAMPEGSLTDLLRRHHEDAEFSENVLRSIDLCQAVVAAETNSTEADTHAPATATTTTTTTKPTSRVRKQAAVKKRTLK